MSFNLTSSAKSPKQVSRTRADVSSDSPEPRKTKTKRDISKCIVCGSPAPADNGRYFDDSCKVVYEHRVCSGCGYAFTVRRPMTEAEKKVSV